MAAMVPGATSNYLQSRKDPVRIAWVYWQGRWPEDPDADRYPMAEYDGVQVVFHGDEAQIGEWTEQHTQLG